MGEIDVTLTGRITPTWVDMGIMMMNGYSTLLTSPELEPHHQMHFCVFIRTSMCFATCSLVLPSKSYIYFRWIRKTHFINKVVILVNSNVSQSWLFHYNGVSHNRRNLKYPIKIQYFTFLECNPEFTKSICSSLGCKYSFLFNSTLLCMKKCQQESTVYLILT